MPGEKSEKPFVEVAFQQILEQDAAVYSVQWLDLPEWCAPQVTPSFLLEEYFKFIRGWTWGIIRPTRTPEGLEFRLLGTPLALLSFSVPQLSATDDRREVLLRISGGILVATGECGRGMFSCRVELHEHGVRAMVQLSDYCPLLLGSRTPSRARKLIYRLTQAYIHKIVTVNFLARLYHDLTGIKIRPVVKNVQVREGIET